CPSRKSRIRSISQDLSRGMVGLLYQSRRVEQHHAAGKIGKDGGADRFRSLRACACLLREPLQFLFLLLQLLNDGAIGLDRKAAGLSANGARLRSCKALSKSAYGSPAQPEGEKRDQEHECHAEHKRIGEQ